MSTRGGLKKALCAAAAVVVCLILLLDMTGLYSKWRTMQNTWRSVSMHLRDGAPTRASIQRMVEMQEENPVNWAAYDQRPATAIAGEAGRTARVSPLWYAGDDKLILHTTYRLGGPPALTGPPGCVIDEDTAYKLFKGYEVLGQEILCDGRRYVVSGVAKGKTGLLLAQAQKEDELPHIAIENRGIGGYARAQTFASALGVSGGLRIEVDAERVALVRCLFVLPFLLLGLVLGVALFVKGRRQAAGPRRVIACVLALVLWVAVGVGGLLLFEETLPQRFIPNQWSDFDFYAREAQDVKEQARQRDMAARTLRELALDREVSQAVWMCVGGCALVLIGAGSAFRARRHLS